MDEAQYAFSTEPIEVQYNFASISDHRTVQKVVRFSETSLPRIVNLALLDILEDGTESDLIVTDNGHLRIVLATVMKTIDDFLRRLPDKIITFRGSDARRNRLYRVIISRELDQLQQRFVVLGGTGEDRFDVFQKNTDYDSFYVLAK